MGIIFFHNLYLDQDQDLDRDRDRDRDRDCSYPNVK